MILLLNFSTGATNPLINNYGHLGGLIVGFFFSFLIIKPIEQGDGVCCPNKIWVIISSVLLAGFTLAGFLIFYL
jgi:hypothetical protein